MGSLRARARQRKAKAQVRKGATEARKALKDSAAAARELAKALGEQARASGWDDRTEQLTGAARRRIDEAHLDERAQKAMKKARKRLKDSGIEGRANELTKQMRESDTAKEAGKRARTVSDESLERLGNWLATGPAAAKLGVQRRRGRRMRTMLALGVGVGAGYAIGVLTAPKRGAELREELGSDLQRLTQEAKETTTSMMSDAATAGDLVEQVRARLSEDPRTAGLPSLDVNVVEGRVFVRGKIPEGIDEDSIRSVIAALPGVTDVDVQVTAGT